MTSDHENERFDAAAGRALWRRASAGLVPARGDAYREVAEEDALLVAAYLDGRLEPAEVEAFEARMAAEPALLSLYLAADESLGATVPVGETSLRRAAALVPGNAPSRGGLWQRLFGGRPEARGDRRLRPVGLAAACVAVLVVSIIGFEIGRFGYAVAAESYLEQSESFAPVEAGF